MKSKVLFIIHMPPPIHGASMVGKYIHDSIVINEVFECHYINLSTANNLTDIGRISLRKVWKYVRLIRDIFIAVKTIKPQLVYITPNACGGAFYKDFLIVEMLKMMRCKIVAHYHNKGVSTNQDRVIDNVLYKKFFKGIKVILLSRLLYSDIRKYVDSRDVLFCPNGIPETEINDTSILERENSIPNILFLSNLLESKGVFILLDALRILKEQGYSFICYFVGGETTEIDFSRFKLEVEKRGLNNTAIYLGTKYGAKKNKILDHSDIFVFPTYNDCFPVVLLEAMQQKLPCISTDEGGIPDIIDDGKTGFIVEKKNVEQLADKISYLIGHPDLCKEMGENGYKKFQNKYTLSIFEDRMKNILMECCNEN